MKVCELLNRSFNAAIGTGLVGQVSGIGGTVGFFFGLIDHPVSELASTALRPSRPNFTINSRGHLEESTLDLIRSVVIPLILGKLAAWFVLAAVGFPLSFTSCLVLTAGSLAWMIFNEIWRECVKKSFGADT